MRSLPHLRPATAKDIIAAAAYLHGVVRVAPPVRVLAYTGEIEGRVVGVGGVAFMPDGSRLAFCDLNDEARSYPVALHRAAREALETAMKFGVRKIVVHEKCPVSGAAMHEKTPRWLAHLGFVAQSDGEETTYILEKH